MNQTNWYYQVLHLKPEDSLFIKNQALFYNQYKKKILAGNHFFWTKIKNLISKEELLKLCNHCHIPKDEFKNILKSKCFLHPQIPPLEHFSENHFKLVKKKYDLILLRLREEFWRNCDSNLSIEEKEMILNKLI